MSPPNRHAIHPDFCRSLRQSAGVTAHFVQVLWNACYTMARDRPHAYASHPKHRSVFPLPEDVGVKTSANGKLVALCTWHANNHKMMLARDSASMWRIVLSVDCDFY